MSHQGNYCVAIMHMSLIQEYETKNENNNNSKFPLQNTSLLQNQSFFSLFCLVYLQSVGIQGVSLFGSIYSKHLLHLIFQLSNNAGEYTVALGHITKQAVLIFGMVCFH